MRETEQAGGWMLRSEVEAGGQRLMRSKADVKSVGETRGCRRLESEMEADDWLSWALMRWQPDGEEEMHREKRK